MEFIQVFIDEVAKGEQSLDTAAGKPSRNSNLHGSGHSVITIF